MFDFKKALEQWKKDLRKNKHLEDGYIEELESHLIDEYESQLGKGLPEEESFWIAVNKVGTLREFNQEFKKNISLTALPQPWESKWAYFYLLHNYIKIAYRSIFRNKGYSFINIAGLSVGLTCALLIMFWVHDELTYDHFHNDIDRIYRVYSEYPESGQAWQTSLTPDPLHDVLLENYPEVELVSRTKYKAGTVKLWEKSFKDETLAIVDKEFFDVFNFPLRNGDPKKILSDPYSVIISREFAEKLFPGESPLGKTITFDNNIQFSVAAVLKDDKRNTQFTGSMFVSYAFLESSGEIEKGWIGGRAETYLKVKSNADPINFENKIESLGEQNSTGCGYLLKLQPFENIHLYSLTGEEEGMYYVYMFSLVAVFILLMACINFMNLSTARSAKRAKEIGLRKVIGANRLQIIKQFYGESFMMVLVSGIFSFLMLYFIIPAFNTITEKDIAVTSLGVESYLLVLGVLLLTGLLAGSYPAVMLSAFKPVKVLKRETEKGLKGKAFRRALVVIQFSLAIGLIFSTVIVNQQLNYLQTKSLGFDKENVLYLDLSGVEREKYKTIKNEISNIPGVSDVTIASDLPSSIYVGLSKIDWEGKDPNEIVSFSFNSVDEDYFKTFDVQLIDGNGFMGNLETDYTRFLVNETAAKIMGDDSPVGKRFKMWNTSGEIVGVVKDFHSKPLNSSLDPMLFTYLPVFYKYMFVKIAPYQVDKVIGEVGDVWSRHIPNTDYEYKFLDETLNARYMNEKRIATLFKYFAGFAIIISLLGLVGLVAYTTQQKVKEIGIRKVLGASVFSILKMISKQFVSWILIAALIALPVAHYFMNNWLEEFAYRIDAGYLTMFLVGMVTVATSLVVIVVQSLKSSLANPIESLKYE